MKSFYEHTDQQMETAIATAATCFNKKHLNSCHFILDTVAAKHDINAYLTLLRRDGTLTQVGVPSEPLAVDVRNLIFGRRNFSGSLIGGLKETQAQNPNQNDSPIKMNLQSASSL